VFGKKKNILMHGVSAQATITRVEDTGVYVNGNPRVELTLQVQPEGLAAPIEATKKISASRLSLPMVGTQLWVKYDPDDPSRVEIDQAKNEDTSAAALAASGPPTPTVVPGANPVVSTTFTTTIPGGQTVIDARNVPGLREEVLKAVADMQAGGNPAELQQAIARAMSQGQAVNLPPGTMIPGAPGIPGVPGIATPSGLPAPATPDPLDQLEKLNELRTSGALTQAEFDAQKAKILGET
jgi:Short C-terminal domain